MKTWQAMYEHQGARVGHGAINFEAESLRDAAERFNRWFDGRKATDALISVEDRYWGRLLSVKLFGWAPYTINDRGQIEPGSLALAGDGMFEWKIDNPGGISFIEWARHRIKEGT